MSVGFVVVDGPDGRTRTNMVLLGYAFEVSWQTRKAALVRQKGIELAEAVQLLGDQHAVFEEQTHGRYLGQDRVIGRAPDGRLLTLAVRIEFPNDEEDFADNGTINVYTAWVASRAERMVYENAQP